MSERANEAVSGSGCRVAGFCGRIGGAVVFLAVTAGVLVPLGWSFWNSVRDRNATDDLFSLHERSGDAALANGDFQAALTAYARARAVRATSGIERKVARARAELVAIRPDLLEARAVADLEYECEWLLTEDPATRATCQVVTGHIAALNQGVDAAKKAYQEALAASPGHPGAHLGLALIAYRTGDSRTAQAEFDAVLKKVPDHVDSLIGLGDIHLAAGETDAAVESYTKAIQAREDARAHHGLGLALARQNKAQEAAVEFQRSIALNPQAFNSYVALGNLLAGAGALDRAEQAFRSALSLRQDASVQVALASVLTRQGRAAEAMQLIGAALNAGSREPAVLLEAARALEALGRKEEARGFYEATGNALKEVSSTMDPDTAKAMGREVEAGLQRTSSGVQPPR